MILHRRDLLAVGLCLVTQRAFAATPVDDLLARIAKARASLRTLKGPFTQTRTIGLLSTDVRSVGSLSLVRPDRLRWELAPPDGVTFWAGPEGLAYRSAHGHGKLVASNARMASALQDLQALLGGDLSRLNERWSLTVMRDDTTGAEIEAIARPSTGSPAAAPGAGRSMRFALAPDLVRPTRALLVEGDHDHTKIEFGDMVVNGPIDESTMRPPV